MICEISIGGVYLPAILVLSIAALAPAALVSALLRRFDVYRLVAHRPLLDVALFAIVLGVLVEVTSKYPCSL